MLVPTLSGYYWMGGIPTAIDPSTATADPHMLPELVELAHYNLEQGTLSMRAALNAGVRIGLGSDAEALNGNSTTLELVRMVHHGLSPVTRYVRRRPSLPRRSAFRTTPASCSRESSLTRSFSRRRRNRRTRAAT